MNFYSFQAGKDGGPTQLFLDGEITAGGWERPGGVAAKRFLEELQACKDVDVIINSPGGDVFAGADIYSMLKSHPGKVTVKIAGIAGSIASEIAMAGDEVLISPVGYIMIHQPWMAAIGNAAAFEQAAEQLREVAQGIVNAYQIKTGMERDKIETLLDKETYMNAQSAIEMGFADGIWEIDREAYRSGPANSMAGKNYGPGAILNRAIQNMGFPPRSSDMPTPFEQEEEPKPQGIAGLKKRRLLLLAEAMETD